MNKILYGDIVKEKWLKDMKEELEKFRNIRGLDKPTLAIVQVGDNPASNKYINNKIKACEFVGINVKHILVHYTDIPQKEMIDKIEKLNKDKNVDGIIVQLPLPDQLNSIGIGEAILASKDVDGFNSINVGKTLLNIKNKMVSCTPLGIMHLFRYYGIELRGKDICIVGRSNIVGKPLASLLINSGATVTVCNSKTKGLFGKIVFADIVILATGQAKYFNSHFFKEGQIIVDVGISFDENGKLCGDVDTEDVLNNLDGVSLVPSPKGVGQTTVAALIYNTIKAYHDNYKGTY